jgi:hypothetical protein
MSIYVSLGSTCSIAWNLSKYNRRTFALPFDWLRCDKFETINRTIKTNFKHLFDKLEIVNTKTTQFLLSTDDDFPSRQGKNSIVVKNCDNIKFCHDFTLDNVEDNILKGDEIILKYQRRIDRFSDLFIGKGVIHFVREELNAKNLKIDDITTFFAIIDEIIAKNQSMIEYTLTVIIYGHNLSQFKDNGTKLRFIWIDQEFIDWKRENLDWKTILE